MNLREIGPDDGDAVQELIASDPGYTERITGNTERMSGNPPSRLTGRVC